MRLARPNVFSLLLIALMAAVYFGAFGDLDWSWQVRTGEIIVKTGELRPAEAFSYTIAGKNIHDFEWLYEAILYLTWTNFGVGGLKFLKLLLVATPLFLLGRHLQREQVRWHGIALALLLAIFVLSSAWNLRPLYCTTIGLILVATMLREHCTAKRPLPWILPLVMFLWANLHPGVIVGQALLGGAIAWEWLNARLRWNEPLERAALWRLTVIGGVGLAVTFLSPDPIDRLLYPFQPELAHPIMRIFVEMQPLAALFAQAPLRIGLIYVVALLVAATCVVRFRQYRLWEIGLLSGLAFLANVAFRSAMDWFLIMLVLGVPHLRELLAEAARHKPRMAFTGYALWLDRKIKQLLISPALKLQPYWPGAVLALFFALSIIPPLSWHMPKASAAEWPVAALDYIERAGLHGRFFAPPDYGAYIGWRLGERGKVYTDTRGFFFPPVLIEDSHLLPQMTPDWRQRLRRVLEEYQTDYFLLETFGARGALWHSIKDDVGTPLYVDQETVLLSAAQIRRGAAAIDQRTQAAQRASISARLGWK